MRSNDATNSTLVIDTGPLSHFAKAGWLGALRTMATPNQVVITDAVIDELRRGASSFPHLHSVLDASWIERHRLESPEELSAFAYFAERLVVKDRNIGETSVLAYAKVHSATAILDDGDGRKAARVANVQYRGTAGLVCEAVKAGKFTIELATDLLDHLNETSYRLPFGPGGLEKWARDHDLL